MNFEAITIDDCLVLHRFGYEALINDEGVIGFERSKENGSGHFIFAYGDNKLFKKQRSGVGSD